MMIIDDSRNMRDLPITLLHGFGIGATLNHTEIENLLQTDLQATR